MWGGRFSTGPDAIMEAINASIDFDKRLGPEDVESSLAHADMLGARGILNVSDVSAIKEGLQEILGELNSGKFQFSADLEDIHMNIEARLKDKIGSPAGRLHTARSRNDQVATDFRLWVRGQIDWVDKNLVDLMKALLNQAQNGVSWIMPGFTHLQTAQPITWGHHMMAYVEMFSRDRSRFKDARDRMNECPLGSAALAGTSFPIDRNQTAKALEFDRPTANSLDAVSDRDFALEFLASSSICAMHLSRLAEELVIWSSAQFRFIELSDRFSTGSSIMPQKKNPDVAELVRGKSGRVFGGLITLLTLMKAQPLAYNKDNQEDKEPLFDAIETVSNTTKIFIELIANMRPNPQEMRAAALKGYPTATDLADYLVNKKIPFREAHEIVSRIVSFAIDKNLFLNEIPLLTLQKLCPVIDQKIFKFIN